MYLRCGFFPSKKSSCAKASVCRKCSAINPPYPFRLACLMISAITLPQAHRAPGLRIWVVTAYMIGFSVLLSNSPFRYASLKSKDSISQS